MLPDIATLRPAARPSAKRWEHSREAGEILKVKRVNFLPLAYHERVGDELKRRAVDIRAAGGKKGGKVIIDVGVFVLGSDKRRLLLNLELGAAVHEFKFCGVGRFDLNFPCLRSGLAPIERRWTASC